MARRPLKKFLLSGNALQVHLLCITVIVVLSISIWEGNAQPDYVSALIFTIVVYPTLLAIMWWNEGVRTQAAVEHVVESITEPEKLRRKRQAWRGWTLTVLFAVAAFLMFVGHRGWEFNGVPTHYIGYFLFGFAILGGISVNIWYGGPLDPRNDPPVDPSLRSSDRYEK